jgi:hypothetical protein
MLAGGVKGDAHLRNVHADSVVEWTSSRRGGGGVGEAVWGFGGGRAGYRSKPADARA